MMDFRTKTDLPESFPQMAHSDKLLMLGSCFAENVGSRLSQRLFDVIVNPFGTLYNPASIADALRRMLDCRLLSQDDFFLHAGQWRSFSLHSRLASAFPDKALAAANESISAGAARLRDARFLILTFGTAYVFRLKATGATVANCHKLPSTTFSRQLLSTDEITDEWLPLLDRLHAVNPQMQIVFTVSPVRHLADGAHGNQISKSTLLLATEKLIAGHDYCHYFPAYEIVLDELRDYRFFAADMAHPSETAVDYVFEQFAATAFPDDTCRKALRCEKLTRLLSHRPMTDNPDDIRRLQDSARRMADDIEREMPYTKHIIEKFQKK